MCLGDLLILVDSFVFKTKEVIHVPENFSTKENMGTDKSTRSRYPHPFPRSSDCYLADMYLYSLLHLYVPLQIVLCVFAPISILCIPSLLKKTQNSDMSWHVVHIVLYFVF